MPIHSAQRVLQYTPEQVFDLVADVESYPAFLPFWQEATVSDRKGNVYYTDQVLLIGPAAQSVRSETVLSRPKRIDVRALKGPFRDFAIRWSFKPMPDERCRVDCSLAVNSESLLLQSLLGVVVAPAAHDIVTAFEKRARDVYGPMMM